MGGKLLAVRLASTSISTNRRLSDVVNNTIVKIEAGKNQNLTLETIVKVLEVSIDELIQ